MAILAALMILALSAARKGGQTASRPDDLVRRGCGGDITSGACCTCWGTDICLGGIDAVFCRGRMAAPWVDHARTGFRGLIGTAVIFDHRSYRFFEMGSGRYSATASSLCKLSWSCPRNDAGRSFFFASGAGRVCNFARRCFARCQKLRKIGVRNAPAFANVDGAKRARLDLSRTVASATPSRSATSCTV